MNRLRRVLDEVRGSSAGLTLDELARRVDLPRDDVEAAIGYWLHHGELIAEAVARCGAGGCGGCSLARVGCGGASRGPAPVLVTIRPATEMAPLDAASAGDVTPGTSRSSCEV